MPTLDGHQDIGLIEINLAGEVGIDDASRRLTFRRGVSSLPSIGDPVLFADRHDLTRVYAPPAVASLREMQRGPLRGPSWSGRHLDFLGASRFRCESPYY